MKTLRYKTGQRWKFKTDVAELEDFLVIGRMDGRNYDFYSVVARSPTVPPISPGNCLEG